MSAALQVPMLWESPQQRTSQSAPHKQEMIPAAAPVEKRPAKAAAEPVISLGFYRRHTESLLRRYLYASMQVGRAPNILGDPIARGWCSSRPIRTFEDAVIFVLDVEKCLGQLPSLDRDLIGRIILQEYTQAETAQILGMCVRTVTYKLPAAIDRLTEKLLASGLLVLPN